MIIISSNEEEKKYKKTIELIFLSEKLKKMMKMDIFLKI
jgi:hypothetical protein